MWLDVSDLLRFYRSPLGQVAQRLIRQRIREMWPDVTGSRVLALGYGTPYLRPLLGAAERAVAIMPAVQGVTRWPREGPSLVTLAEETALPFADNAFDRIILVHALESSEQLRPMLRETWRVLAASGRLMVIVPNRRGLWARLERTPFGHGHPYSPRQLDRLLTGCMFLPTRHEAALYMPPSRWRMILRLAAAWERLGTRWLLPFSGVILTEAEKQVYAAIGARTAERAVKARTVAASNRSWRLTRHVRRFD